MGTVVMTVSADRPAYLEQTLRSWRSVRSVDEAYFIFCVEPGKKFIEVHRMLCEFLSFRGGIILLNSTRLGVLRNPHHAFNKGFETDDFVILAEEDVEVSNDVLEYFDFMRDLHRDNSEVLAVCAENWCAPGNPCDAWFLDDRFTPLVWGTWRDRWVNILRDTWDLDYSTGNPDGSHAGWDWNINRIIKRQNLKCVAPGVGRSLHIGKHGVHMLAEMFEASQSPTFIPEHTEFHWKR